jgi:hypothetical protein
MSKTSLALVVVAILTIGGYIYPKVDLSQIKIPSFGSNPGTSFTSLLEFQGGVRYEKVYASSTNSTTLTLGAGDIASADGALYDTVVYTPQVGDITVTFPASSTMRHLLPRSGMRGEQCWVNASSTSGIQITFAGGTGTTLKNASSSAADLTLEHGDTACFKWVRATSTSSSFDFHVLMTEWQ